MGATVWLDDQVSQALEVAARVVGFKGPGRFNAAIRRLMELSDEIGQNVKPQPNGRRERVCTIDELVLDQSLRGSKPTFVYGPDGESEALLYWSDAVVQIANWLIDNGHIMGDLPPISGFRIHPLISKDRRLLSHPDVGRECHGGWYVETWRNINTKGRNLRRLLLAAGVKASQLKVGVAIPAEK